jgi:hypothetical protein
MAYKPVAGQTPRNRQRVQPLLRNRRINKYSFLCNGRGFDYNNENNIFYMVRAEML